ncbi:SMC-Scp complex subunit ScpB [Candidatus Woesearchaeota archaeon]|nr:SMC-Scp complex subunit ScpB [Candidatus Woesearchaeota archaeon]
MSEVSNQIEALLFSSGRAMNIEEIFNITNLEKKDIKKGLKELKEHYDSVDSSLMISQEGDLWKFNIKEKYISLVTKIVADTELIKSVLETLSVVAWKSPVLQSEVIKIRTSKAYEHIKELVDAGFITKEKEGRSYRIRISEKFFEYFDVPGDKGIKEAFKEVKVPEKKEPEKVGELDVVPVSGDSEEHGRTKEIFGEGEPEQVEEEQSEETEEEEKQEIPPVDGEFLDKINKQIDEIAAKNDKLEDDELFKRRKEEQEVGEGEKREESSDEETPLETEEESSEEKEEESEEDSEKAEEDSEESSEKEKNVSS